MVVCRGDVIWARLGPAAGSDAGRTRPVVVVQRDSVNRSRFNTILVVPLTSQTRHAHLPGNVLLNKREANLPKPSVARATHVTVVDRQRLTEKIGVLSGERLAEIIQAIRWVIGD